MGGKDTYDGARGWGTTKSEPSAPIGKLENAKLDHPNSPRLDPPNSPRLPTSPRTLAARLSIPGSPRAKASSPRGPQMNKVVQPKAKRAIHRGGDVSPSNRATNASAASNFGEARTQAFSPRAQGAINAERSVAPARTQPVIATYV